MERPKNQDGFTLVELLVTILGVFLVVAIIWGGVISTFFMGNFWYTEEGVLRDIQIDHPGITQVLHSERNVYADSVFTVQDNTGNRATFTLDSSVFFNYEITKSDD